MLHCWYCGTRYPASDKNQLKQVADGYWCKDPRKCVDTAAKNRGR